MAVSIYSYNMHGLNLGQHVLRELCKVEGIILLQDHWLGPDDLNSIYAFSSDVCFATSAICNEFVVVCLEADPLEMLPSSFIDL